MKHIAVGLDTSGGVSARTIRDSLNVVMKQISKYHDFELSAWCFDTCIYKTETFNKNNINDILNIQLRGGGGTMFECNWDHMKKNHITPDEFYLITDGYPCDTWGDPYYCKTIFVINDEYLIHNKYKTKAPFGKTVFVYGNNDNIFFKIKNHINNWFLNLFVLVID